MIYFNRSTIDPNRVTQIILNTIVFIALAGASGFGSFSRLKNPQFQNALILGSLPIALIAYYFGLQADEQEPFDRMRREANLQIGAGQLAAEIEMPSLPMPAPMLPAASAPMSPADEGITTTPLESVLSIGTGICLFGNSGAGKSSIIQWLIGEAQPESLIILDPDNDGVTWGDLPVVDDYDAILDKLADLLEELKQRRDRRKKGLPNPPVMIVAEEWPDVRAWAKKQKNGVCDEFVQRFGCGARKCNMVTLLCSQSGNVKSMGLDGQGDFLHNWCLVRLGEIAKKYAKTMPDRLIADAVKKTAYPCLINDELSYHPTHGHYPKFKNGQHPQNIKPYRGKQTANNQSKADSHLAQSEGDIIKKYLDNLYDLPGYQKSEPSDPRDPSSHPESLPESPSDTQSGQGMQPLSDTSDLCFSLTAKEGYPAAILGSHSLLVVVQAFKNEGQNQEQIIRLLWGLPKNGKPKYKQAVEEYKSLLGEI